MSIGRWRGWVASSSLLWSSPGPPVGLQAAMPYEAHPRSSQRPSSMDANGAPVSKRLQTKKSCASPVRSRQIPRRSLASPSMVHSEARAGGMVVSGPFTRSNLLSPLRRGKVSSPPSPARVRGKSRGQPTAAIADNSASGSAFASMAAWMRAVIARAYSSEGHPVTPARLRSTERRRTTGNYGRRGPAKETRPSSHLDHR